jgi:hypothetical protein
MSPYSSRDANRRRPSHRPRRHLLPCSSTAGHGCRGGGFDAIELYAEHRPDAAVLDVSMPGLSGIDATEVIMPADPLCQEKQSRMHLFPASQFNINTKDGANVNDADMRQPSHPLLAKTLAQGTDQ